MEKTIRVEGMMCMHCVAHVKKALEELPGVTAEVDLDGGRAVVRAEQLPDDAALTSAVTEAGYKVAGIGWQTASVSSRCCAPHADSSRACCA